MALQPLNPSFSQGGSGLSDGQLKAILSELRSITTVVVAGAAADTKIDVAALRPEHTLISAIGVSATTGALTEHTANVLIQGVRAVGTLTLGTVVAGNTATVAGKTFTFRAAPALGAATYEVALGADASAAAANLAAEINLWLAGTVTAVAAANVVTITAVAEGTPGNAVTTVGGTNVTAGAATLAGGTSSGGFKLAAATTGQNIILTFFKK